jgi:DNA-binding IclR family transcriptional regulator
VVTIAVVDARSQADTPPAELVMPAQLARSAAPRVLGALAEAADPGTRSTRVRVRDLAHALGVTDRTVQRALRGLAAAGLLRVEERGGYPSTFHLAH